MCHTRTLLGCAVGIVLAYGLLMPGAFFKDASGKGDLTLAISPATVAVSSLILVVVGTLSGLVPALNASRLDPVEALRHE